MKSWVKAQKTAVDGYNFPSKLHAAVYMLLKFQVRAGVYSNLRCEVTIPLVGKLKFKVDFVVFNEERQCDEAHEAKGYENARFKTIEQVWYGAGPMDLHIWKGHHSRPSIVKTIRRKND